MYGMLARLDTYAEVGMLSAVARASWLQRLIPAEQPALSIDTRQGQTYRLVETSGRLPMCAC